jgi:hypothetical protein
LFVRAIGDKEVKKPVMVFGAALFVILSAGLLVYSIYGRNVQIDEYSVSEQPPRIYPDYSSTVIPPNIAPLNFMVQEVGSCYFAKIYSEKGRPIEIFSRSAKILIPPGPWNELLNSNKGKELHFDIFVRTDNHRWVRYSTFANKIACEDIDGYLVYRRMYPNHYPRRGRIGIYQRNLSNFDEKLALDMDNSHYYMAGCVNCHTFLNNRPDKVLIGARARRGYGTITLLVEGKTVSKLERKFGFTTWHPSGRLAVFSINTLPVFFHTARMEMVDTVDLDSALAYFVVDSKTIKTSPNISRKDRLETWPNWSADGRHLYFCSAPIWTDHKKIPLNEYEKMKYDLVRISYDVEHDQWGEVETVLSAHNTGKSVAMPRISPDGRWLIFCMLEYGFFPLWQQSSDLYIMDLKAAEETGRYEYRRLDISSDESESWHSWSCNSRWIAFSSKKEHGGFTRCYLSYVDDKGKAYKPLAAPQKDPLFYSRCLDAFNTPEFATGPILASKRQLARAIRQDAESTSGMPITMATPGPDAVPEQEYWRGVQ